MVCPLLVWPLVAAPGAATLPLIAPNADSAVDEEFLDKFVATPLTSLSASSVGSLLTNSFCSNCTTTYGRARLDRTLSPLAEMSLTWICPLDAPPVPLEVPDEVEVVESMDGWVTLGAVADNDPLGVARLLVTGADGGGFALSVEDDVAVVVVVVVAAEPAERFGGGGCCMLNTGACRERLVVGKAVAEEAEGVNGAGLG